MTSHRPKSDLADDQSTEVDQNRSQTLSPGEMFNLLANQRRRYALYYLTACEYAVTVDELVQQIAVWETETNATDISDAVHERIHIELVHSHLPKLADSGVISYDEASQLITLSEPTGQLDECLRRAANQEEQEA